MQAPSAFPRRPLCLLLLLKVVARQPTRALLLLAVGVMMRAGERAVMVCVQASVRVRLRVRVKSQKKSTSKSGKSSTLHHPFLPNPIAHPYIYTPHTKPFYQNTFIATVHPPTYPPTVPGGIIHDV